MMNILNKHKKVVIISMLLLCLTVGISIAFFQDATGTLTNSFDFGNISTEVDEKEDPTPNDATTISKKPIITNTGDNPALIRVRVTMSPQEIVDEYGLQFDIDVNGENPAWIYNPDDEFYYYTGVLKPNASINVFTKVTSTEPLAQQDDEGKFIIVDGLEGLEIGIYHESVQSFIVGDDGEQIIAENGRIVPDNFDSTQAGKIWSYFNSTKDAN